ncbi:SDR family oxidoreductase [Candidatus Neomarinimicrobiota bacterium]
MKILLTGATGYIGKRLLPILIKEGHSVVCCVRDVNRFNTDKEYLDNIEIVEVDFLNENSLTNIPKEIDAAYYLIHSMSSTSDYQKYELECANNFKNRINITYAKHVIYLSGIVNQKQLSKHLGSRKAVENKLNEGNYNFTALRAGIIIGSGSASFEIIRDLVEKLPIMVTPKWLNTKCQPISIEDVVQFLFNSLNNQSVYNNNFDIGGPDILTYREMLLDYAKIRKLKRWIYTVPVMTPKLSSYWLYFITSTSYKLAIALVDSMKIEVVCRDTKINKLLNITPVGYMEALKQTVVDIDRDSILSSWKDSFISGTINKKITHYDKVPTYGCYFDKRTKVVLDRNKCIDKIWRIGGNSGWYYANWLWRIRGFVDKIFGGVGLRRGRTHAEQIDTGDVIDFWRVLHSDKEGGRLLLFAEMKLPGEAWLEFKLEDNKLYQTATFLPKGLLGRLYWFLVLPLHGIVFNGLIKTLSK